MTTKFIETGKSPKIEIGNCAGDLVIRTWMNLGIGASGEFQVEEGEELFVFNTDGDLQLEVPERTNVKIGTVYGDLVVKNIAGSLSISDIYGDVVLTNVSQVKIGKIRSDLSAKSLQGALMIEMVSGDIVLRNINDDVSIAEGLGDFNASFVNGAVSLKQISGDVNLRTISGDISIESVYRDVNLSNLGGSNHVENAHGDIRILGSFSPGTHRFNAQGDLILRWPVNAPINLVAEAPDVQNRLPLVDVKKLENGLSGRIGDGETAVHLNAGGRIMLKEEHLIDEKWRSAGADQEMDFMFDWAGIGERVSAEVSQHISRMADHLETHFGPEFAQNISQKVSKQAEKAARQAEKAAEKAQKYAEREAYRAQNRHPNYGSGDRQRKTTQTAKAQSKTTSEEQMKILKMVENGTITPEEANTLLEALES